MSQDTKLMLFALDLSPSRETQNQCFGPSEAGLEGENEEAETDEEKKKLFKYTGFT